VDGSIRVAAFGDTAGLPRLTEELREGCVRVLVRAGLRPEQAPALDELARRRGLDLLVQPRASAGAAAKQAFVQELSAYAPDLIVVDSYSMLLPAPVLAVAKVARLNLHGALLPAYRGPNPVQWALINDERKTGVTLHLMDSGFDTGAIVDQRVIPIAIDDTWRELYALQDVAARTLLHDSLPRYLRGEIRTVTQDPSESSTFPRRTPEDGIIDWERPALAIHNLIRALVAPLPGAFYERRDGSRVVLDRYVPLSTVLALKFGNAGRRRLEHNQLSLEPASEEAEDTSVIVFRARDRGSGLVLGKLCIREIDWERRRATIAMDFSHDDAAPAVAAVLAETGLRTR
jgi:methionyl-tRNA formyltransferase